MEFLKEILGDGYAAFEAAVKAWNGKPENKDKQVKIADIGSGDYVEKGLYDALEAEKNGIDGQLQTATQSLEKFKEVDVDKLRGELETLSTTLQTQKGEYEQKIADMNFQTLLSESIRGAGGRSAKAVMAELDMEALKSSKNQKEDIKNAINACKEANSWMFGTDEPFNNPTGPTGGPPGGMDSSTITLRAAMGLPEAKN